MAVHIDEAVVQRSTEGDPDLPLVTGGADDTGRRPTDHRLHERRRCERLRAHGFDD